MTERRMIDVDITDRADGKVPAWDDGDSTHKYVDATPGSGEFTEAQKVVLTSGDISTSSTTFVDATGLSITMTTAAVRCLVIFSAAGSNVTGTTRRVDVDLAIDGTRQGQTNGLLFAANAGVNILYPVGFTFLTDVLTAASHTFKIQYKVGGGAGTVTLFASAANTPAILTVLETSMAT